MFHTLATPLVAGRDFTWTDLHDMRDVAIISENLARELWESPAAALGKRVREYYAPQSPWREIVGVAGDVHDDGADQRPPATIYWPAQPLEDLLSMSGYQSRLVSVAVRTHLRQGYGGQAERAGTERLLGQVREAVSSVSAVLPLAQVRTLDEVYDQSMARTSFTLVMLAIAGAMALLGVSGLYGVIAYAVSRRRREIGHPAGSRRADARDPRAVRTTRSDGGGHRNGDRPRRRSGRHTVDAIAALRHQPARSSRVHRDARPARGGCRAGQPSAGAPRGGG